MSSLRHIIIRHTIYENCCEFPLWGKITTGLWRLCGKLSLLRLGLHGIGLALIGLMLIVTAVSVLLGLQAFMRPDELDTQLVRMDSRKKSTVVYHAQTSPRLSLWTAQQRSQRLLNSILSPPPGAPSFESAQSSEPPYRSR